MASAVIVKPCYVRLVRLKTTKSSLAIATSNPVAVSQKTATESVTRCPVCQKQFKRSYDMEIHIRVHTGERPFACTICKQRFKSQGSLRIHSSTVHSDKRPFSCIWCDKNFQSSYAIMLHLRVHTKEKPYFCQKCPDSLFSVTALTQHEFKKHNVGKSKNKKCEYCSKMCYTSTELQRHRRIHTGEKPYSCSACGKCFGRKSTLVEHSRVHSERIEFNCTKCPKAFRFKSNLTAHILNVHEKVRHLSCEICGKSFCTKQGRDRHINSHLNEKPFKCPKCPKRFARPHSVVYHVKAFHENKRDFKCSQCPLAYVNQARLDEHFLRRHVNPSERPFHCLFCSKTYCARREFENHLRSHILEKPHFCTLCPSSYTAKVNLRKHLARVH